MAHRHRSNPKLERTQCYSSQVAYGADAEPRAHGGVCFHQECECGARRFVNANGKFVERGQWFGPARAASRSRGPTGRGEA